MQALLNFSTPSKSGLDLFHEDIRDWFIERFGKPTESQLQTWPAIASGQNVLLAAPTGSGKTIAAFLWALDALWRQGLENELKPQTFVLYVSPLKALSHDVKKNLEEPLQEIRYRAMQEHLREVPISVAVRTGDTPPHEREAMRKQPPHLLITTPESLYLLLTSLKARHMLKSVRTVIIDEVHALAGNRRGAHLALSLERLEALTDFPLQRIGLSATQKPLELVAQFLVGNRFKPENMNAVDCAIIDVGKRRQFDLAVEIPPSGLTTVMALEVWEEVYDRILALIASHRTTLIFVSTRRLAERMAHRLRQTLGDEVVAAHHGSMSRERRLDAEQRLKSGSLKAMVATASLELGIDIGSVDLVLQMGSPRSLNSFLQRAGRSRHQVGGIPKARLFPLTSNELIETAGLLRAIYQGELDTLWIPELPLDVLSQQIVAEVACHEWEVKDLYHCFIKAQPYRNLSFEKFREIVQILAQGYTTRRGRHGAHVHFDDVNGRVRGRPGARLTAILNGGAIPDAFDYEVRLEPGNQFLGTVNEDFAVESMAGDVFLLGNGTWRIIRVEENAVRVADAQGEAPSLPFWLGEAPSRSHEMSAAISAMRQEIEIQLGDVEVLRTRVSTEGSSPEAPWKTPLLQWLAKESGLSFVAANCAIDHLASGFLALGTLPTLDKIIAERFFDSGGDMHLVLHCPFGGRVNRAFGLALRKRFCRKFNFELQAAATEEGIILSLGATHSFPLEEVFQFLRSSTARGLLEQAVLDSPMFEVRWRWNATRFLAIPRRRCGKRVPPIIQRLNAQDLAALVFPDQIACAENIVGERQIPDHPLVRQTLDDCLHEAMDIDGLESLLRRIENGSCQWLAKDVTIPSTLAEEIISARPYAFLDGAPLEERRTRAITARAASEPDRVTPSTLLPESIISVGAEAWPSPRDADELHDALLCGGFFTPHEIGQGREGKSWGPNLESLQSEQRVGSLVFENAQVIWVASERWAEARVAFPQAKPMSAPNLPLHLAQFVGSNEEALRDMLRSRLEISGAISESSLHLILPLPTTSISSALLALENEGFIFRGDFIPGDKPQWCERRLLFRMRQRSVSNRRQQASSHSVSAKHFQQFIFQWQGVIRSPSSQIVLSQAEGVAQLAQVLQTLEGYEAPGELWEKEILPRRIPGYEPAWLDTICQSGRFGFCRLRPPSSDLPPPAFLSLRYLSLAFFPRQNLKTWKYMPGQTQEAKTKLSGSASIMAEVLRQLGASFADEIFTETKLLPEETERAFRTLMYLGLMACDSFTGMRTLWKPMRKKRSFFLPGRFFLLPENTVVLTGLELEELRLFAARVLLRRYGVVFRKLADKEPLMPPWRELRLAFRTLEDRGEVRGGRFIEGIFGEQFALPEALESLVKEPLASPSNETVILSISDPANLQGILSPEKRVNMLPKNRVHFVQGIPKLALESGKFRILNTLP